MVKPKLIMDSAVLIQAISVRSAARTVRVLAMSSALGRTPGPLEPFVIPDNLSPARGQATAQGTPDRLLGAAEGLDEVADDAVQPLRYLGLDHQPALGALELLLGQEQPRHDLQ